MSVYMVWVKPELIEYEGPRPSFSDQIGLAIRTWAYVEGYRYIVRAYKVHGLGDNSAWFIYRYALGFTDPNAAFAYKMRFG